MREKLIQALPKHEEFIKEVKDKDLYLVDTANGSNHPIDDEILLLNSKPEIAHIHIKNENSVSVIFDPFQKNALPIRRGCYSGQCECVLFPTNNNDKTWILFVEMKYVKDIVCAQDEKRNYPEKMLNQIIKTVDYFREKEIISNTRLVKAIISFPTLPDFNNAWILSQAKILELQDKKQIQIRATNKATLTSEEALMLG